MRPVALFAAVLLLAALGPAARSDPGLALDLKDAPGAPSAWAATAQRDALRPACRVDAAVYRSRPASLAIAGGGNPAEYGGWTRTVTGLQAGHWYRFTGYYRVAQVPDEDRQVVARIDWRDAAGQRVAQPEYPFVKTADGAWTRLSYAAPAPAGAVAARVELLLGWAPQGTVWWDDVALREEAAPAPRPLRLGTVSVHPRHDPDPLGAFLRAIDAIAPDKPDIVCLGEEINLEGNGRTYLDAAEPIPGPSTERLGERARRYGIYLVAGLTERDGALSYNTAVLIDRQGRVAGKYRKVYLPREEIEGGLTPGRDCPVFDTDFGRVAIMVCWDGSFPDVARIMGRKGAEVILVPAAGGYLTFLRSRALENHLYVVTSGYDVESSIINPGNVRIVAHIF
jgi:predicted amidohydrolase